MRTAALVLAAALVLGGVVGVLIARDPGYVLVAYQDVAVETSLWFALAALVLGCGTVTALVMLLARLRRGGGSLRGWSERRRVRTARERTVRGLLLMPEARWSEARKLLEDAAPRVDAPLVNYLNAARAAQEMGDIAGRDALLHAADDAAAGEGLAVGLTRAELQYAGGQWEPCLATLLELYRQSPRHPRVLYMLVSCYRQLQDWQAIIELVDELGKHRVLDAAALEALQLEAWQGRFAGSTEAPESLWKSVPAELKRAPAMVSQAARALASAGQADEAEKLVRAALEHGWDAGLVRQYGTLMTTAPERQLTLAEGWLQEHPDDPDLLLTLGRISLMNQAWAKAREYLETSLRLRRSVQAQSELGRLLAALGDTERGGELLTQAVDDLPVLPLPARDQQRSASR